MRYYVTWTEGSFSPVRKEIIDYFGTRTELAKKLGDELLKELQAQQKNTGKKLKVMLSDRAAVIHCAEGIAGTVAIETYRGESNRAILEWLK